MVDDFIAAVVISAVLNAVIASSTADGDFFSNLFSAQVGGSAFVQGLISATLTVGLAYGGSLLNLGFAALGGGIGGISGTYINSLMSGQSASIGQYILAGSFGAIAGLGVHLARMGFFQDKAAQIGQSISELNKDIVNSLFDSASPGPKVPGPM